MAEKLLFGCSSRPERLKSISAASKLFQFLDDDFEASSPMSPTNATSPSSLSSPKSKLSRVRRTKKGKLIILDEGESSDSDTDDEEEDEDEDEEEDLKSAWFNSSG